MQAVLEPDTPGVRRVKERHEDGHFHRAGRVKPAIAEMREGALGFEVEDVHADRAAAAFGAQPVDAIV
ncbi:MAG: hypothetical protein WDN28_19290 [Chthoniobacter sp.]